MHPYSGIHLLRSTWHYLSGKAMSALITIALLLWLVRSLPVPEYGAYVTLIAGCELAYAIGGIGLPWLSARYLPEYRLYASGRVLVKICHRLLLWQTIAFLVLGFAIMAMGDLYLQWVRLPEFKGAALMFLVVVVFEGLGRFLREPLMGPLMLQGAARVSLVSRQLLFFVLLIVVDTVTSVNIFAVAAIEAVVSVGSFVIGWLLLERHLNVLGRQVGKEDWQEPSMGSHWAVARRMYFAHLLALTYSPQILTNVVMRMMGGEAAALFGFLRTLNDQVGRYLPASLLFSLIRPKLVASYVGGGGMPELTRNANLAGKLSLFVLVSLVAFAALSGEATVSLLSGGKFTNSGWLLLGFLGGLIPFSQRQLLESVAVTIGRAGVCALASASGLVMLPLTWALIHAGLGLWAPVAAIGVGHLAFNVLVLFVITRNDGYRPDWPAVAKMFGGATLAYLIFLPLPFEQIGRFVSEWSLLALQAVLVVSSYLILAWVLKPFSQEERDRINALLKRRVFIW